MLRLEQSCVTNCHNALWDINKAFEAWAMRAIWSAKRFNCAQCIVVNNNATRDVTREAILLIPVHIRIRNNTAIFRQFYGNFADFLSIWMVSERAWNKCLPICIGNITATFPAFCIWTRLMCTYKGWSDICSGDICSGDDISDNKELEWG